MINFNNKELHNKIIDKMIDLYLDELDKKIKETIEIMIAIDILEKEKEHYGFVPEDNEYGLLQASKPSMPGELSMPSMQDNSILSSEFDKFSPYNEEEMHEIEFEKLKSQLDDVDKQRLDRYYAVADVIQSHLTDKEIYVEISQIRNEFGDDYEMPIKIATDVGPMNVLSKNEMSTLDSGEMTLSELMNLIAFLK